MSPAHPLFVGRLRMFPSLVNCCTIDLFTDWPEMALVSVADGQIETELNLGENREAVVNIFSKLHTITDKVSKK